MVVKGKRKPAEQRVVTIIRQRGKADEVSVSTMGVKQTEPEVEAKKQKGLELREHITEKEERERQGKLKQKKLE